MKDGLNNKSQGRCVASKEKVNTAFDKPFLLFQVRLRLPWITLDVQESAVACLKINLFLWTN